MSHIGTFGSFGQARLAIYAAQLGLSVTGNNISNVNTVGYTRQRLDQVSFKTGGADRYQAASDVRVGNGVLPTGVSQLRDPYLDIRYRNENASVGAMSTKLEGLDQIAAILDEIGKGGEVPEGEDFGIVAYQLGNLFQALMKLEDQTGQKEYDVQVRSSAASLCQELRSYASQLEKLYNNTVASYKENITKVNNLLTNIRDLNSMIRKCDIHGDNALELRDQRNLLIDELSGYMKINVTYTVEDIGAGKTVEKLMISLDNANPDKTVHTDESLLVDGRYCTQLQTSIPVLNKDMIYEKEGGGFTADPEQAVKAPRENDKFDPNQPEADPNFRYLDADGNPVEKPEDAAQDPVLRTDTSYLQYKKADGTFTNDPTEAIIKAMLNPNPATNQDFPYLDKDGNPTDNNATTVIENTDPATKDEKPYLDADGHPVAGKPAQGIPEENPDYKAYVDKNNMPTADLKEAQAEEIPDFGLRLSELRDINGRLLETVQKMEEREIPEAEYSKEAVTVTMPDGTKKITTYRSVQKWILKPNDGNPPLTDADGNPYKYISATPPDGSAGTNDYTKAAKMAQTTYYAQDFIQTPSVAVDLDDNDLLGSLQSQRELLTESGEFTALDTIKNIDEGAAGKRGIPYYQNVLDLLANQIATAFNNTNKGYLTDPDGNYITEAVDPDTGKTVGVPITITYTTPLGDETFTLNSETTWKDLPFEIRNDWTDKGYTSVEDYLAAGKVDEQGNPVLDKDGNPVPNGLFRGGNLFSVNGDTDDDTMADGTPINASNISISASWMAGPLIVNSFVCAPGKTEPESTHDYNILKMQGLQYAKLEYLPQIFSPNAQDTPMFVGTFEEMFSNVSTILGNDQQITSTLLDNFYQETVELDSNRANVSSVDFNDEAMNLMQYSKSYNAACRLMTTLDSVLDKLINGTGVTT